MLSIKVLLEWIQFKYDMVTLFVKNNIKKRTQNMQWKQRYRYKQNRSMTRRNVAAEWRRIAFVHDAIGDMAIATSVHAKGDSSHRKGKVFRRWYMTMCRRNLFHYDLRVCLELQVLLKLRLASDLTLTKSTRTVTLQDVQPYVTSGLP